MNTMMIFLALAQGPGEKLKDATQDQVGSLFLAAVIILAVYCVIKRAFSLFIGLMLFAMFASVFVFSPENIADLGGKLFNWLFEDWLSKRG